jgi:hypothetical protein
VLFAAALVAATAGGAGGRSSIATTGDPVGDAQGAPDICAVAISRTPSTVSFRITLAGRPPLEPGDRVSIVVDSDQDVSTGNRNLGGADVLLSYGRVGRRTFAGELVRWNGTRWEFSARDARNATFSMRASVLEVVLERTLLGPGGFDWVAVTFQAGTGRGKDSAPDEGMTSFAPHGAVATRPCGPASRPA